MILRLNAEDPETIMQTRPSKKSWLEGISLRVYSILSFLAEMVLLSKSVSCVFSPLFDKYQILARSWRQPPQLPHPALWIHAASVGEARLALALWETAQPLHFFPLFTVQTVTALHLLRGLRPELSVHLAPLDGPRSVSRAFKCIAPEALWIIETELWPQLLHQARARGVPVLFLNGRISARAFHHYRRFSPLFRPLLQPVWLMARLPEDEARFLSLGVLPENAVVQGDAKCLQTGGALPLPAVPALEAWLEAGPVLIAASTHAGEEVILLEAFRALKQELPSLRLILAPRHPERVAREAWSDGLWRRSQPYPPTQAQLQEQIFVLDSLGELSTFYPSGRALWAGGTLVPVGGHNLFELAVQGAPVLYGPYTHQVEHQVTSLERAGQGRRVRAVEALVPALRVALSSRSQNPGDGTKYPTEIEKATMSRAIRGRIHDWLRNRGLLLPDSPS